METADARIEVYSFEARGIAEQAWDVGDFAVVSAVGGRAAVLDSNVNTVEVIEFATVPGDTPLTSACNT